MENNEENDLTPKYKVILVGESSVGKTCIIKRYIENNFNSNVQNTIAESFLNKEIEINGKVINLEIWDTAGGEQYRSMANMFFNGSSAVILIYDITSLKSYEELKNYWYQKVKNKFDDDIGKIFFF